MKIVFVSVKTKKKSNFGDLTFATANFQNLTSVRQYSTPIRILFGFKLFFSWYLPNFHQLAMWLKVEMAAFYEVR